MTTQLTIEAIDQVIEATLDIANAQWRRHALASVEMLAMLHARITSDDVWQLLDGIGCATVEPRSMGGIMRTAAAKGWIEATGDYAISQRPECHKRPVRVWASRLVLVAS